MIFDHILSIVSSLLLNKTRVCKLLVEGILIDHSLVEFRLCISNLQPLLLFTSHGVLLMARHLIQLLELIVVLVDLSLQFAEQVLLGEVLGEYLVVCDQLASAEVLLQLSTGSEKIVEDVLKLVLHVEVCGLSYIVGLEVVWDQELFISHVSQVVTDSSSAVMQISVYGNVKLK